MLKTKQEDMSDPLEDGKPSSSLNPDGKPLKESTLSLKHKYLQKYVESRDAHKGASPKRISQRSMSLVSLDASTAQERLSMLLQDEVQIPSLPLSQRPWFTSVIGLAVVANAIQLGVEVDYPEFKEAYSALEHIFTSIFTLEMIIKLVEMHFAYFKDGWNLVDFVLVWLSILDCWFFPLLYQGSSPDLRIFSMLRILRILRLLRAVRLFKFFGELWKIVKGLLDSLRAVTWAAMLLIFLLYICGVFCCVMVGKNDSVGYLRFEDEKGHIDELGRDFDVYQFYGTVPRSMYTLFETCIEPLNVRPVIERQPWMSVFFLFFIFVGTFGVLNVIIGVIVQHTMEVNEEKEEEDQINQFKEKMDMLELVRDCCFVDQDGDGVLDLDEMKKAFENSMVVETLQEVEMPLGVEPHEMLDLLDASGTGNVDHKEMLIQLTRAAVHTEHQQLLDLKIGLHQTRRQVIDITSSLDELKSQVKYGFCQILPEEKMRSWPTGSCSASKPEAWPTNADKDGLLKVPKPEACVHNVAQSKENHVHDSFDSNEKAKSFDMTFDSFDSDKKCFDNSKIQSQTQARAESPHDLPEIPGQLMENSSLVDDHDTQNVLQEAEKALAVVESDVQKMTIASEPVIGEGDDELIDLSLMSHSPSRQAARSSLPNVGRPSPSRQTAGRSSLPNVNFRTSDHFFSAPTTGPPRGLQCSDVDSAPLPPDVTPTRLFVRAEPGLLPRDDAFNGANDR